jgi:hypothetical protein
MESTESSDFQQLPKLSKLIGQEVMALIPILHPSLPSRVIIHGLEVGGIWVEHDKTTQKLMRDTKLQASPETVVLFVPYSGIGFLVGSIEKTALHESSFSR